MKNTINKTLLITTISLITPCTALASDLFQDVYLGAAINSVSYAIDDDLDDINDSFNEGGFGNFNVKDSDTGFKLFAGYSITENVSVEVGYYQLGKFGLEGQFGYQEPISSEILDVSGELTSLAEITAFDIALKAQFPLSAALDIYGKAGLFNWSGEVISKSVVVAEIKAMDISESSSESSSENLDGSDSTYTLGLSYHLSGIDVFAELQKYQIDEETATSFNLGLLYNF
ncbi:outer membrane beta-barrel protein [Psychrosphaera sp. 1_MG-2023]|uniref:Outer membrane beta-barrel protein n=1 Tax=Psychrosphaera algicola TaxID=3023714 RepID=A0ABT5F9R4_9GAMM|nr:MULTISPECIES: outer membrane beta-barrel protein [unclassified Psychrosphaera]MDC2888265.1 outer membrane beta-barrel protein [Psychrosphaera sp. G1-22]MDO6718369.1 outer membrane beta-barrel protein [Psychrosphaera sp. 1_MG-2023]